MDTDRQTWTIVRMEQDPRDSDRVLVAIGPERGDERQIISLYIGVVSQEALRIGLLCPPEMVERMQQADQFQKTYNRALNFLAVRPRSVDEVRKRLRSKGVEYDDIEAVIQRLERAGYLDDAEFARIWVRDRMRVNPRGPRLLRQELYQKGVAKPIIEEVMAGLDEVAEDTAPAHSDDEDDEPADKPADAQFDGALELARRKLNSYGKLDDVTFKRRMSGFLLRRGYSYGIVSRVLKRVRPGGSDDEEEYEDE